MPVSGNVYRCIESLQHGLIVNILRCKYILMAYILVKRTIKIQHICKLTYRLFRYTQKQIRAEKKKEEKEQTNCVIESSYNRYTQITKN